MNKKVQSACSDSIDKLIDIELAKRLSRYQELSSLCFIIGISGIVGGIIAFFAVQNALLKSILVAVLFFGGICCILFFGTGAQRKLKLLLEEQLGGYFNTELENAFGPELHSAELSIDPTCMTAFHLPELQWEECTIEHFREGIYHGLNFSAANVYLNHLYESGNIRDGRKTLSKPVFKGLVIRCRTVPSPSGPVHLSAIHEHLADTLRQGAQHINGRVCDLYWNGSILSIVLETNYKFAAISDDAELCDPAAVRRSYTAELQKMKRVLDLLLQNTEPNN